MFGRIKRLFKSKQNRPKYTTFTISIEPEFVNVTADWADPQNISNKELMETARRSAVTILQICNFGGFGLNEFQRAIGRTAEHRKDQIYANSILGMMRAISEGNNNQIQIEESISPLKTFDNI